VDPDPGGYKWSAKSKKNVKYFMFEELDGFLWGCGLLLELRNRALEELYCLF
jgi:hypothetical protein